ncbi:MAG: sulfotransferase domain-containing protein, partial [Pseudomonadales bacterium]|nr:sulfotransferase domain-containing protein [Pseudomonadales bacterium]
AISIDEFATGNYLRGPAKRYWAHLASWWKHRDDDSVLLLAYELMNQDPEGTIRRVADFCGIALDDALLAITLENSSLPYMLKHKDKFDDLLMRELSERFADLPPGSDSSKVREGKVGGHKAVLSADVLAEMDEIWRTDIEAQFGFTSYQQMVDSLRQ